MRLLASLALFISVSAHASFCERILSAEELVLMRHYLKANPDKWGDLVVLIENYSQKLPRGRLKRLAVEALAAKSDDSLDALVRSVVLRVYWQNYRFTDRLGL